MCLAVPGEIVSIESEDSFLRTGKVRFGGIMKDVSLACVPEAAVGDYILVHVGMAISKIDEEEAHEILECLRQIGEAEDAEEEPTK